MYYSKIGVSNFKLYIQFRKGENTVKDIFAGVYCRIEIQIQYSRKLHICRKKDVNNLGLVSNTEHDLI